MSVGRPHRLGAAAGLGSILLVVTAAASLGGLIGLAHEDLSPETVVTLQAALKTGSVTGTQVGNDVVSLTVPEGWSVRANTANDLVLDSPGGLVELFTQSGVSAGTTVSTIVVGDLVSAQRTHGQAGVCEDPVADRVVNGPNGAETYGLCFTAAGVNTPAYPVEQIHQASLAPQAGGTGELVLFQVVLTCARPDCDRLANDAGPVLRSVAWSQLNG